MQIRAAIVSVVVLLIWVTLFALAPRINSARTKAWPLPSRQDEGYVTSQACVTCHPGQHASWHASFHHTMTQWASPKTVVAPFDGELEVAGQRTKLERIGDEFWVEMVDLGWERDMFAKWAASRASGEPDPFETAVPGPRVKAEIVMTTGSHHFQAYWVKGKEGRELWQFPWRYHIAEQRWVHRKDVFLAPPEWRPGMWFRVWNNQCIYCHSTGPYPGEDLETHVMTDTKVAELGITCEACHGPAADHVVFHQDKTRNGGADPIVNPARVGHRESSQICGSCHSHFHHSDPLLSVHGPKFRPGQNLFHFGDLEGPSENPQVMSRYWGDGVNRSGGREFSGLSNSACYREGELACVSCHSMHESNPDDQLSAAGLTEDACVQCHIQYKEEKARTEHTHHLATSTGNQCYNCHMPHTNYALFKAIRSHTIDSPKVEPLRSNSRPNACNLCHLDQTLQWTADQLHRWYGISSSELTFDDKYISAGVLWAWKGDAGQRVIAAWHFGWDAAREVSGSDWMIPTITQLMLDPYAAVRWVAFDALRKDPSYRETQFDFDSEEADRNRVVEVIRATWSATRSVSESAVSRWTRILFDSQGMPNWEQLNKVLSDRDNRLVAGVE